MKVFIARILAAILTIIGIWGQAPATRVQNKAMELSLWNQSLEFDDWGNSSTGSGSTDDIKLDKNIYTTTDTRIKAELPDYCLNPDGWTDYPFVAEIIRQDTGDIVFYEEVQHKTLTIAINLHPGRYSFQVCQYMDGEVKENTVYSSTSFLVDGASTLFHLTGEAVADGDLEYPDFCFLLGVRLEWDGSSDGGPYTVTRTDEGHGEVTVIEGIYANYFIDGEALPGGVYTYVVSDGNRTSNPIVLDLRRFPPLEYAGNKNDKVIVLKIGDPYMYTAKDRQSALKGIGLTRFGTVGVNGDKGVVPTIKNGRTLIPIAHLVRTIGGPVVWDGTRRRVTIKLWGNILEIPIGSKTVYFNGQARTFDTPARIERGRTLVPVRHLELLGCEVDWVGKNRSVVIGYQSSENVGWI